MFPCRFAWLGFCLLFVWRRSFGPAAGGHYWILVEEMSQLVRMSQIVHLLQRTMSFFLAMTTTFPAGPPERPVVTLSPRTISTPVLSGGMVFGENRGGHRQRAHRYAAAREAKAAEAPPKRGQSEKPAAKRKRDERERNAASRTNEQVARTGSGRRVPVPEVKAGGRKFSAPTSPRPLENGLGGWQREKAPSGELDADERKKLNERRRKAKTRAEERTQRQLEQYDTSDDAPTAATAAAAAKPP